MTTHELAVNGKTTGVRTGMADNFFSRFLGQMGKKSPDGALLITRCSSIHTFFMRVTIDAVFLDSSARVVRIIAGLKPWRIVLPVAGAASTLELESGSAYRLGIKENDVVTLA